jgi:5-(carboxyamino)imidazole ribonucleotide synthase
LPILPGAQIGILGGGQLGRMTAMAAQSLGYGVRVLDPDPHCAASAVADEVIVSAFDDPAGAEALARKSAVLTYEIEQIGQAALAAAERHAPVRPSPAVLAIVQDRLTQKEWLARHGFPVGPFRAAASAAEVAAAAQALGRIRLKARRGGYDGRSQAKVDGPGEAPAALASLGGEPVVCEQELELRRELSVMVARNEQGEIKVFPPAQNWHQDGILSLSVLPGAFEPALARQAEQLGRAIAEAMQVVGLLAIEFFDTASHGLLVNELSPRPHNTFHATETACLTSQFEQMVRAVCGLPLGSTDLLRPTALANLLGDLWLDRDQPPRFDRALALPGVYLRLYGKQPRHGRKVGHLLAVGHTPEEALQLVRTARESL